MDLSNIQQGSFIFVPTQRWHEILNRQLDALYDIGRSKIRHNRVRLGCYARLFCHLELATEILGNLWSDQIPADTIRMAYSWVDALAVRRDDLFTFMQDVHCVPSCSINISDVPVTIWYVSRPVQDVMDNHFNLMDPDPNDPFTVADLLYATGVTDLFKRAIPWGDNIKGKHQSYYDLAYNTLLTRAYAPIRRAESRRLAHRGPMFELVKPGSFPNTKGAKRGRTKAKP